MLTCFCTWCHLTLTIMPLTTRPQQHNVLTSHTVIGHRNYYVSLKSAFILLSVENNAVCWKWNFAVCNNMSNSLFAFFFSHNQLWVFCGRRYNNTPFQCFGCHLFRNCCGASWKHKKGEITLIVGGNGKLSQKAIAEEWDKCSLDNSRLFLWSLAKLELQGNTN